MSLAPSSPVRHILIVDDDPAAAGLTRAALRQAGYAGGLHTVSSGTQALALLQQQGDHGTVARPDLILLDWHLPGLDGHAVLAAIKSDPALCRIPVVIVTSSDDPRDIAAAYAAHATCYVLKALDLERFLRAMAKLVQFWGDSVLLPSPTDA